MDSDNPRFLMLNFIYKRIFVSGFYMLSQNVSRVYASSSKFYVLQHTKWSNFSLGNIVCITIVASYTMCVLSNVLLFLIRWSCLEPLGLLIFTLSIIAFYYHPDLLHIMHVHKIPLYDAVVKHVLGKSQKKNLSMNFHCFHIKISVDK